MTIPTAQEIPVLLAGYSEAFAGRTASMIGPANRLQVVNAGLLIWKLFEYSKQGHRKPHVAKPKKSD